MFFSILKVLKMLDFLNNNFYLSIIVGVLVAAIDYFINKPQEKMNMKLAKRYIKLGAVSILLTYIAFYIRTKKLDLPSFKRGGASSFIPSSMSNIVNTAQNVASQNPLQEINIGEPNF